VWILGLLGAAASTWVASLVPDLVSGLLVFSTCSVLWIAVVMSMVDGFRPVAAVFSVFTFAWLGVAPAFQLAAGMVAWRDTFVLTDVARVRVALAMTAVAALAFLVGMIVGRRRYQEPRPARTVTVRGAVLAVLCVALIGLAPVAIRANGGFGALFTTRQQLQSIRAGMGQTIDALGGPAYALTRVLPGALAVTVTILAVWWIKENWRGVARMRMGAVAALVVGVAGMVLFVNPFTNTRFAAAAAFGSVLWAITRPRSRASATFWVSTLLFVCLLVYPLANAFRFDDERKVKSGVEAFLTADFDGFQQVINTISYVEAHGHTLGNQILSAAGFIIPRSIWVTKAEPASYAIAQNAGYSFVNLSLPIHAELYLEFGWLGVVLGMLALGLVAARLDDGWLTGVLGIAGLLTPYVAFAMLGVMRGPIGAQIPVWGTVVALLLIGVRRRRLSDDSRPPNFSTKPAGRAHRFL